MADNDEFAQYKRKSTDENQLFKNSIDDFSRHKRGGQSDEGVRWGEVFGDLARTPVDLASSLYNAIAGAPESVPAIYDELKASWQQPTSRKLTNLLAGVGNFGDILNQAPANARDYFIRKGAPEDLMPWLKRPEKHDWQQEFGLGEAQSGDKGLQAIGGAVPAALLTGGTATGAGIVGGLYNAGENENPFTAALGAGTLRALGSTYRGLQNARGGNMANQISEARNAARETSRANYNNFNIETQAAGVNSSYRAPRNLGRQGRIQNQNRILNDVPDAYTENFRNYINNGQRFEDAIQSVSDLRGYANRIYKMVDATPEQLSSMRASFQVADRLESAVHRAFDRSWNPGLRNRWQDIKDFHANEVIPYKPHNEAFSQFGRDRIGAEDLIQDLTGNREFMHMLSDRFSGFRNRNRLETAGKLAKYGGIPTAGGLAAYNFLGGNE